MRKEKEKKIRGRKRKKKKEYDGKKEKKDGIGEGWMKIRIGEEEEIGIEGILKEKNKKRKIESEDER